MSDNQQFCLRWNNHQSTLVQVIDSLLSSGVLVDCTLAAEGQYLHAHKVVLCACSPYLETLLSQHYEKHPIVILKDVKFQELKSMMDYMYKGEVNISQDQLGQFLKAAESLQIKGLTDGGGGENDSRDVGSTSSQKRHEPAPVRKTIPHNQSRSPVVLPSHTSGLTIEPSKRSIPTHLSDSQPDSPIRSREGSTSPTSRKRRRTRRLSQGDEDSHADNSCDLPMTSQSMSITSVPSSIPPLPSGSSSTITKAPPPDEDSENPESDRLGGLPEGLIKEKIEPQSEMLIEPKTEYMDETNNDDSVEDLTLDDDDDYENMMESGAGPSHSANNPNENYAAWQQITGDRQDDAYLNPSDTGHRDSQGRKKNTNESVEIQYATEASGLLEIESSANSSIAEQEQENTPGKRSKKTNYCPDSSESENAKNSKKRFTPFQVETLKRVFEESAYITQSQAATIARQTGLKKMQVRKWFSDYRCKIKRQSARLEQYHAASEPAEERRKSVRIPKKRIVERFESKQFLDVAEEDTEEAEATQSTRPAKALTVVFGKRVHKKNKKRDVEYVPKRSKTTESNKVKRFSPSQVDRLKKTYAMSPYITQREAAVIARNIGLKKMQVRKWFCDYRCKMKKQSQQQNIGGDTNSTPQVAKKNLIRRLNKDQPSEREPEDDRVEEIDETYDPMENGVTGEKRGAFKGRTRLQKRTFRFTEGQLSVLNVEFDKSQFLTEEKLNMLCIQLKERRERIQTWFTMKRYKHRQSEQKFWQNIIG